MGTHAFVMLEDQLHDTLKGRALGRDGSATGRGFDTPWSPFRGQAHIYAKGRTASAAPRRSRNSWKRRNKGNGNH